MDFGCDFPAANDFGRIASTNEKTKRRTAAMGIHAPVRLLAFFECGSVTVQCLAFVRLRFFFLNQILGVCDVRPAGEVYERFFHFIDINW